MKLLRSVQVEFLHGVVEAIEGHGSATCTIGAGEVDGRHQASGEKNAKDFMMIDDWSADVSDEGNKKYWSKTRAQLGTMSAVLRQKWQASEKL